MTSGGWKQRLQDKLHAQQHLKDKPWLRWLGPALHHPNLWHFRRRAVAKGAAIGVFFAFIFPIAQIPMAALTAVLLRGNLPVAALATFINTPLTFGPVYLGAWYLGNLLQGESASPNGFYLPRGENADWLAWLSEMGTPLFMGAGVMACTGALLTYLLINNLWRRHSQQRWQRRRARPNLPLD